MQIDEPGTDVDPKRGELLVRYRGYVHPRMLDALDVCAFLRAERVRVDRRGKCSVCDCKSPLISHYATGETVCPNTLRACPPRQLNSIVSQLSRINA